MASTSLGVQVSIDNNLITSMLAVIMERLTEEEREKIDSWLPFMEEHAEQIILRLNKNIVSKRRPEIIAAAALYDAFLEFESRSSVKIRLPLMRNALGLTPCSINSAWTHLFDNRVFLRKDCLYPVRNNAGLNPQGVVNAVLTNVARAIIKKREDIDIWIDEIRILAGRLLEAMDFGKAAKYDSLLIGTAAIYAAIRNYAGKPHIHMSQRDLAQFGNHSPAMLSKVWLDLFASE